MQVLNLHPNPCPVKWQRKLRTVKMGWGVGQDRLDIVADNYWSGSSYILCSVSEDIVPLKSLMICTGNVQRGTWSSCNVNSKLCTYTYCKAQITVCEPPVSGCFQQDNI